MKKFILLFFFVSVYSTQSFAQLEKPIRWSYKVERVNKTTAILAFKAIMNEKWHIYSLNVKGIPAKTTFTFSPAKDYTLLGPTIEPKPISKYDKVLKTVLTYFEKEVVFTQKVRLNKTSALIKVAIEFMACNDKQCLPTDLVSFNVPVK